MKSNPIISVQDLVKKYSNSSVTALNSINLTIYEGEIVGLLGPNGAGKTTFFSILCGLLVPTKGKVIIDGKQLDKELNLIKKQIGVVPQDVALYPTLTGRENLLFIGRMYGLKGADLKRKVDNALNDFGFNENRNHAVNKYSGGMKRRVNLIAGILHQPKIIFLDEPTVGIDVQSRMAMMEHLKKINLEQKTTIIYTSHYMEQAAQFCDNVAILDEGSILEKGTPKELIKKYNCESLEEVFIQLTGKKIRD
ncbi:MAG: ABC transporter ATP-binding protein [Cyclobacteriaceae bacterium]|nr:ABC transporter ATP-binding protein [Cyclobacteriaceae bacterium]